MRHYMLVPAALLVLAPVISRADWRPGGSQISARPGAIIASNRDGGVFAATGYPDHFPSIYQLTVQGDAADGWPASGRQLTPNATILEHNSIAPVVILPDGTGGTYLLTAEQIGYTGSGGFLYPVQFFVHRRTSAGTLPTGWTEQGVLLSAPVVDHTFEVRHLPTMVADGLGGVIVAWLYHLSTEFPDPPIHAQRVTDRGARVWGNDGIVVHAGPGACTLPTLVADGSGGALVFWGQWDAPRTSIRVFGQHITAGGEASWQTDGQPISSGAFSRLDQAIPADGGWVRQFYAPSIAAISDGEHGAILGWAAATDADLDVYAARVSRSGATPWQGDRLLCAATGEQSSIVCADKPAVGAVFAWRDGRDGIDISLRAQLISRQGVSRWPQNGALVAEGSGDRGPLVAVKDGHGSFFFAWGDPVSGGRVFAQRLLGNGHRAPGWARNGELVSTRAGGDPNPRSLMLGLVPSLHGSVIVAWSDPTAGSLAMRLTPSGPAAPATTPLATLHVPGASNTAVPPAPFALRVRPHPVVSAASLRFVLPTAAPASLELFDVAGRPIWSSDVSALGPGEHVVRLAGGRRLSAGIYFVRLAQGARVSTQRIVVLP